MNKKISTIALLFLSVTVSGKIKLPTMGWSSWNTYGINICDSLVRVQADAMVEKGLSKLGYDHINIDDGYFGGRDKSGKLITHPVRFPRPMRSLVDYIHSKGLKAGIYSDAGSNTCGSVWSGDSLGKGVGMYAHYEQDARLFFNEWNFDFIKIDYCGGQTQKLEEEATYKEIASAIKKVTKKDIDINICRWAYPGTWVSSAGFSWRTTNDINASWGSVKNIIHKNLYLSAYTGGGHYSDLDMLEVGRGMSQEEDRTHFGIWCMMSSPLLIGCDLSTISNEALRLISNPELIAVNQDRLGLQAQVVKKYGETYVLAKDVYTLNGRSRAVALYNSSNTGQSIGVDFAKDLCLEGKVKVRNLIEQTAEGSFSTDFKVNVPSHATRIYLMEGEKRTDQTKYEAETAWLKKYQDLRNDTLCARYDSSPFASGEMVVSYLGNSSDNYMEWRNMNVSKAGKYKLTIAYSCDSPRNLSVSINGKERILESLPAGKPAEILTTTISVSLKKGENIIRLGNARAYAPDIDYIEIVRD